MDIYAAVKAYFSMGTYLTLPRLPRYGLNRPTTAKKLRRKLTAVELNRPKFTTKKILETGLPHLNLQFGPRLRHLISCQVLHLTPGLLSNRFTFTHVSIPGCCSLVSLLSIMRMRFQWRMPPASENRVIFSATCCSPYTMTTSLGNS